MFFKKLKAPFGSTGCFSFNIKVRIYLFDKENSTREAVTSLYSPIHTHFHSLVLVAILGGHAISKGSSHPHVHYCRKGAANLGFSGRPRGHSSTYGWTYITDCLGANIHQMTTEQVWLNLPMLTWAQHCSETRSGGGLALTSRHLPAREPVIILIMWLSELMLARGEASPAVSINEPSLDAALISHCTAAALFTTATSLTPLIPKGFFFFCFGEWGQGGGAEVQNVKLLCVSLVEGLKISIQFSFILSAEHVSYKCKLNLLRRW